MPAEAPQIRLSIGGMQVEGVVALEVESVGYFAADRFNVACALSGRAGYFAALGKQDVTIEVAADGVGYATLLVGQLDNVRVDLGCNEVVLAGRDLAARLIDAEIAETFANQTASQIALTLAGRRGLTPNVAVTSTQVGQYYELDHARSALATHARSVTEWSLLTQLAQAEGFALWVSGERLNFGPWPQMTSMPVAPENFLTLTFDMINVLPAAVTVKSWNTRNKAVVSQSRGNGVGTTLVRPNLTAAQARSLATSQLTALGQHGVMMNATMPGDTMLRPGMTLVMAGTDSALDQSYAVLTVTRRLSARRGFEQNVTAYAMN
ncbi:phage late control D family protein [Acidocella aromatica]|uniref:Phage protein D n=1 Tax=Acidocella aromatica TaxID=1303579 RepID=A0A840VPW3_9PROT|nr:hypothetical protein [Acidocella aromatica]MBB5373641.1 phage protein D [Acidocella aromatica]